MIAERPTFDVLVIGSGPAGQNAALEAAEQGARVLIIEQEPQVGGACVQYGTIPSKTLRETALTLTAFQRRSGDVYQISHDAELSVTSLMKRLNEVVHAYQETTRDCLEQAGVERAYGRARFVSAHDIEFTRNVATSILAMTPPTVRRFPGGYDYYHEKMEAEGRGQNTDVRGQKPDDEGDEGGGDRKALRRERAEKRQEQSKLRRPLENKIKSAERKIADLEKEQEHQLIMKKLR